MGAATGSAIVYSCYRSQGATMAVVAALGAASLFVGGVLFDHFKNRYLAHTSSSFREGNDLEETRAELATTRGLARLPLTVYSLFLSFQRLAGGGPPPSSSPEYARLYRERLGPIARGWAYLGGPTTHVTLLALSACLGNVPAYIWARVVGANLLLLVLFFEQWRRERGILRQLSPASLARVAEGAG